MKKILFFILLFGAIQIGLTREPLTRHKPSTKGQVDFRADCQLGISSVDLNINNVRARLLSRGDFWWDYSEPKYIVPNVEPGEDEISSVYSGAVWMGGFDGAGNLKLAAVDYAQTGSDYYPGPLDPEEGTTDAPVCAQWDRHFEVKGANITQFINAWKKANAAGTTLSESDIPEDMKYYPARGNPYFASQPNGFILPDQELGSFYDFNENGKYEPLDGDYPAIDIRGCKLENYADQMFFQIYNDNGGPHSISKGSPIRMEIQVQAFAYATSDELNDMTFMRYKLINRALDSITECYFAMWVDADLGCSDDDFVGCDTSRSLAYYYNADDIDGETNCSCSSGFNTYCERIPLLGIDYFRGPLKTIGDTTIELGMSSFTYYNNGFGPLGMRDPGTSSDFYNYLTGKWKDGTPFYGCDDGYQDAPCPEIKYAFPSAPDDPNGWSMEQEGLSPGDRRTVQASGPFTLERGKTNELIIGLPWVPNVAHPAPDISKLLAADDKAQNLFDACFEIVDGPDAPDMDIVELNNEIIITLSNDEEISNNAFEKYKGKDIAHEGEVYKFEGYQIFQTVSPSVSLANLDDPDLARIVAQTDQKNNISKLYNWELVGKNPSNLEPIYLPVEKVAGSDEGMKHSFRFTRDEFGSGDAPLINHRKYYYVAIAYAYNNFSPFNPDEPSKGQKDVYLAGRKPAYGGKIKPVTVIPRPSTYTLLNAKYGDGPMITRLSGSGTGGNFLVATKESVENAFNNSGTDPVTYMPGQGPINVKIVNPLKVVDGKYRLTVTDGVGGGHAIRDAVLTWILEVLDKDGQVVNTITSDRDLDYLSEQVLSEYGISIEIGQRNEPGNEADENRGATGMAVTYQSEDKPRWLITAKDNVGLYGSANLQGNIDFVQDTDEEPAKAFTQAVNQRVAFYPFNLMNISGTGTDVAYSISPGWINPKASFTKQLNGLHHLNNVDIVMTSDKSKWSRCVVTEAASSWYGIPGISEDAILPEGGRKQFYLRDAESVSKEAGSDGKPKADGTGRGMGWFPGYAIDVETGKRLNIFFAENSTYRADEFFYPLTSENDSMPFGEPGATGADMMFNPSYVQSIDMGVIPGSDPEQPQINAMFLGGQHFVYVTYDEYDGCAELKSVLENATDGLLIKPLSHIQWGGLVMASFDEKMLPYGEGLIPNDVTISLRAQNPYTTVVEYEIGGSAAAEVEIYGDLPVYEFELKGVVSEEYTSTVDVDNALDEISVVPNPYYGYAYYERSQFTDIVKVTNVPAKSTVTIYSLDGKFIRKFERDEVPVRDADTGYTRQIGPDVEWDLKNASGIPVASGVYLVHIEAPGLGERVIKWFGMNRQFDPSGL